MKNILLLLPLFICCFALQINAQDTLWTKKIDGKAFVIHKVKSGEDIFLLSRKYNVPPAVLADANNLSYQSGLASGNTVWIPVDNYNFIRIESVVKSKPIFYKVNAGEELKDISRMVSVAQSTIQMWNHLSLPNIKQGQILQIGWIAFDNKQVPFAKPDVISPNPAKPPITTNKVTTTIPQTAKKDTIKIKVETDTIAAISPYEQLYETQTGGNALNNESGAAVFYPLKMKMAEGIYYAFHNTAPKGTIVKVTNPANGNFIYAKVIGTIPKLAEYNNCVIALSTNAAKGLMAKERRMFGKIEY